jgi:molybdopterin-synthase adenylyltransferase
MRGYQLSDFDGIDVSIAFAGELDDELADHLTTNDLQEELTFAYWHPSTGTGRYTAILHSLALPSAADRLLKGNVAFTPEYIERVVEDCPDGSGIALIHSHLGPGWQGMSYDDIVAERDRLAGLVASETGLPLVGLTWGTDRTWSGRLWLRAGRNDYRRHDASTVRVVGRRLRLSFHPELRPRPRNREAQVATRSVWGEAAQEDLVRVHVGIVGLGSVGSIVAEALSRTGIQHLTLIDHDRTEERNLDRTLGAFRSDADDRLSKVAVSERLIRQTHTADDFRVTAVSESLLTSNGLGAALDCDVLICCVDRPWPRHLLNKIAYAHLIPVIDGGILARVSEAGALLHVDWRIHTVGPQRACLYCLKALLRSDAALDRDGMLDDPDYLRGLSHDERERYRRRNVFAFSLSVASHEVLQLVGLITGNPRIGGIGPQTYHAYPGEMDVEELRLCDADCDIAPLTASASGISPTEDHGSGDPQEQPGPAGLFQRFIKYLRRRSSQAA